MSEPQYRISETGFITLAQMEERLSFMDIEAAFHEWLSIDNPQLKEASRAYMRERMANEKGITLK